MNAPATVLAAFGACLALAPGPSAADGSASTALARYVAEPDPASGWRELAAGETGRTRWVLLLLHSQRWRGIDWWHQLLLLVPEHADPDREQGFLFVHGGRWKPGYAEGWSGRFPRRLKPFVTLAEAIRSPVGVLRQVPFQPLFGRREDALIAHTFDHYLDSGDEHWPLLLPMVKATVRAMDAMQSETAARWGLGIERFTVSGASKRGWTSWLAAAVDPRVGAVAPMVIDMLDIPAQIDLQEAVFGGLSEQVQDYADIGLPERVGTERGEALLEMVDPWRYRDRLRQPKLIVLGTNDRYWPLGAVNVYWEPLAGPKHLRYFPNEGHSMRDYRGLIATLAAFHRRAARGAALPALDWRHETAPDRLRTTVQGDPAPRRVRLWTATSGGLDFRDARWRSKSCRRSGGTWRCERALRAEGYTAVYAEARWREPDAPDYALSTTPCIVGPAAGAVRDCLSPADIVGAAPVAP